MNWLKIYKEMFFLDHEYHDWNYYAHDSYYDSCYYHIYCHNVIHRKIARGLGPVLLPATAPGVYREFLTMTTPVAVANGAGTGSRSVGVITSAPEPPGMRRGFSTRQKFKFRN